MWFMTWLWLGSSIHSQVNNLSGHGGKVSCKHAFPTMGKTTQRISIKKLNIDKLNLDGSVVREIRRMEQERTSWMKAVTQSNSFAEQMKRLAGEPSFASQMAKQVKNLQTYSLAEQMNGLIPEMSLAVQTAKQLQELQKAEQESVRRMLGPLQNIRKGFLEDSATKLMLDNLTRPISASDQMTKLMEQATRSS